jgi:hypothetical protein
LARRRKAQQRAGERTAPSIFRQQSRPKLFGAGERPAALPAARMLERAVSEIRDDLQNTTEIEVIDAKERWSEYRLADGTTMRIKSVVIAVFRDDGHPTPDGEPVYNMKSTLITDVRAAAAPKAGP